MTAQEYVDTLRKLGLPQTTVAMHRAAAALIGITSRQSFRFASGENAIPVPVTKLLACYLEHGLPSER